MPRVSGSVASPVRAEAAREPDGAARRNAAPPLRVTVQVGAVLGRLGMGQGGYKIARGLVAAGADVRVIAAGGERGLLPGARVETVDLGPLGRALAPTANRLWPAASLAILNNYFDWRASQLAAPCDVFYGYSDQSLWSLRAALRLGAVTVLHAANTHIDDMIGALNAEARRLGVVQNWISPLMAWKIRREYRAADRIRAQSTLVRDSLIARGVPASKILLIPPAVDLDRFQPAHASDGVFRVAFVGSFEPRKGIQYLLRAWDAAALPRGQLILHGGTGSRYMRKLLQPYRERPDVRFREGDPAPTYAAASVVVVPSIEDGFAYVVLEALASGCPVVLSDQVGGKDAVVDGENGFVVPAHDTHALRDRLVALHADPCRRARMARVARQAAERFSFAAEQRALGDAFARLVAGRAAARVER